MSDFKPVNQPITPTSADPGEEFPFLHTITVVDRVVSVDNPELVQNNIRTETVTLNLDSEWDGLSCIINIGSGKTPTSLIWSGQPVVIPAELMTDIGTLNVSVVGYGDNGTVRAVTKKADAMFVVAASGYVHDDNPVPDPTTILGQLTEAADRANQAADRFNQASEDIGDISNAVTEVEGYADAAKTSETNAAASATAAQQAVDGLQTTVKEQGSKINQNTNTISQVSQKADSLEQKINSFKDFVSETYTTKDEFNALEIGGTNLAENTGNLRTSSFTLVDGTGSKTIETDEKTPSNNVFVYTPDSGKSPMFYFPGFLGGYIPKLIDGETYTVSAWVKFAKSGGPVGDSFVGAEFLSETSSFRPNASTQWQRYWVTGKYNASIPYMAITFYASRNVGDNTVYISSIKVEKGTKPTAWSPALEDFDGKYASKTELNNYVPLSTYQALEARVRALEAKLSNQ